MRTVCSQDRSARGFSWCVRRVSGRSPVRAPPFSAAGGAMRLDRGGVDRQSYAVLAAIGQALEDCSPASAFGPAIEAIVDGRVGTILGRAIAPAGAALEHMDDAADDPPIVISFGSRQVRRQGRRNACPLPVIQPKQSCAHQSLPSRIAQHERIKVCRLGTDPSSFADMVLRLESRSIDGDQSNERKSENCPQRGIRKHSTTAR